ncbi:uncharacterized protein APUU_40054S [Aspergillus puulaauensis]|uniref:Major facilitator superfamily (MFS) profile domain-containing protein n=1 Tax=Aspergillus puulaauensis TaxID=1220207 RepID=A0A7R7XLI6_9EURO|nr:uncharacterized protein APUU_40054S [Aspergillus puulaauensis]BCS23610.1 hypothetical protein APUU_40054S [Aspergillus puulaauensis]
MAMGSADIEAVGDTKALGQATHTDSHAEGADRRIRRKTDKTILALLTWIYFLQVFDKAVLGTGAVFNLQEDANLTGNQYSLIGSISPIAQLAWQPFSAWLIVKVPPRILMPSMVLGWGIAEASMAACHDFTGLITARFFLGLFEAGCLPLFTYLTGMWYRRVEQPMRISIWNGMNGVATMAASAVSYGLGHIPSEHLKPWQTIFLFAGLLTVVSAPVAYWKLDNDISTARFLTEDERLQGVERLRANQTGGSTHEFKWAQVLEVALEPKSWLWVAMAVLPNMGSAMTSIFGPLIITGFGFDKFQTSLLNIPFGAVQTVVIVASCWAASKVKIKSAVLIGFTLPVIVGIAMLYGLKRDASQRPALLVAYYLCAFLFAGNPLLLAWLVGNTAGATKKSTTLALFQAGVSAGALAGPLLFTSDQAPGYLPGIRGVLGLFIALIGAVIIQLCNLVFLNKMQRKKRIANGKSADIIDQSMRTDINAGAKGQDQEETGEPAYEDLTDRQNDQFVYIY